MLLAFPMKFSAKQVYFPSSDLLIFWRIKVPSMVIVTLVKEEPHKRKVKISVCSVHEHLLILEKPVIKTELQKYYVGVF